jgi:hypothetical protein
VGSVLVVDPDWTPSTGPVPRRLTDTAALIPLAQGAILINASLRTASTFEPPLTLAWPR